MTSSTSENVVSVKNNWPLPFMLDEVWLRVRRVLIHNLEKEELWPLEEEYDQFIRRQQEIGERVKSETLREIVGDADYVLLNSDDIFGADNMHIRKRLPYVASFGYSVGLIIYNLINKEQRKSACKVSEISSVFNIGIAIFDYIHDEKPDLFYDFTNTINYEILHKILTDKQACEHLLIDCNNIASVELRLLSKIIVYFFLKLYSYHTQYKKSDLWKRLVYHIVSAYDAEIRSKEYEAYKKSGAIITSKKKSIIPFQIIYLIALIISISNSPSRKIEKANEVYCVSKMIGEIFWHTDDLVDLLKDLESDHLNSILNVIYNDIKHVDTTREKYQILIELLNGSYIEDIVSQICSKLSYMLILLKLNEFREEDIKTLRNTIICFVRNWVE